MRILMLSWEYPPSVAGHGRHAAVLARHLAALGHEVHVVTRIHDGAPHPIDEWVDGVHVVRVAEAPPVIPLTDRVPAVLSFNSRAQAVAARLIRRFDVDVLHVHDRLLAYAASGLRDAFGLPMVATIHATEHALHPGLPDDVSKLVHQVEWWLTYEAGRVITCTREVHDQLCEHFRLPASKVDVVPVAVDVPSGGALTARWRGELRASLAGPRTRVVLVGGRLDEHGLDRLLAALPALRAAAGPTKLVVAAGGVEPAEVRRRARRAGARHRVLAPGHLRAEVFARHAAVADAIVILDDDEPCGATVLDALAADTPVVVAAAAGASDLVADAAVVVRRPAARTLAGALAPLLSDVGRADQLRAAARARVAQRHAGPLVARATLDVYERTIAEDPERAGPGTRPPLRPILQAAPLLELDGTA